MVLAAGRGARLQSLPHRKPLLTFGDRPMLARVVETLNAAHAISPLIVVTGYAAEEVRVAMNAFQEYFLHFIHNDNWENGGMLSSVQCGVRALPDDTAAFFLSLGDQPLLQAATLHALLEAWRATQAPIVLPSFNGRRGHPVLFDIRSRDEILVLPPDATLRDFIRHHDAECREVEVPDSNVRFDIDTPEDYERALALWHAMKRG